MVASGWRARVLAGLLEMCLDTQLYRFRTKA